MTRESDENRVKLLKSILSPEKELNYQIEVKDHVHTQVQFQKRDNLSKFQ